MADPHSELLEIILRECAAARPQPWYPSEFAQSTGVPRAPVDACLDQLRLAGLIALTPWVQGHGQGYQLTPHGEDVLGNPRLLNRLREGEVKAAPPEKAGPALSRHALSGQRGEKVRTALLDDSRPIVTQALLAANIVWFVVGLGVYMNLGGVFVDYFTASGGGPLGVAYYEIGSLALDNVLVDHQWWRLLSYGFIHGGFLHLGMNMYALFAIGPLLERMWGRAGYLTIYFAACIGGGGFALVLTPGSSLIGASGAICGLLGSMMTWLLLNKGHLPPHIVSSWQRSTLINVVLITVISFLPQVSWAGHLGGGVMGALIAAPLNLAHFGDGAKKLLGWAGATAITVVGLCLLYSEVMKGATTAADDLVGLSEVRNANRTAIPKLLNAEEIAKTAWALEADVLNSPKRPEESEAKAAKLRAMQQRLTKDATAVAKAGPFHQPDLVATIKAGLAFLEASARLCGETAAVLDPGAAWPPPDKDKLRKDLQEIQKLYSTFGAAWQKLKAFGRGDQEGP